jgi:hypothetical protein
MKTYRITYLIGKLDASTCPPALVSAIFPAFDGWPVTLSESECIVTVPDVIEPLNLSPLIKIELISE